MLNVSEWPRRMKVSSHLGWLAEVVEPDLFLMRSRFMLLYWLCRLSKSLRSLASPLESIWTRP